MVRDDSLRILTAQNNSFHEKNLHYSSGISAAIQQCVNSWRKPFLSLRRFSKIGSGIFRLHRWDRWRQTASRLPVRPPPAQSPDHDVTGGPAALQSNRRSHGQLAGEQPLPQRTLRQRDRENRRPGSRAEGSPGPVWNRRQDWTLFPRWATRWLRLCHK